MRNNATSYFAKALMINIIIAIILAICLCLTSGALVYSMIGVEKNVFTTARFDIEIYNADGVSEGAIITEADGYLFAPGVEASKPFILKNNGTADAYFRLYFDFGDDDSTLSKHIKVKFTEADGKTVYDWKPMCDIVKKNTVASSLVLKAGEELNLLIWFYMEEDVGREAMDLKLTFDLCADAIQTKNNDGKIFYEETQSSSNTLSATETE